MLEIKEQTKISIEKVGNLIKNEMTILPRFSLPYTLEQVKTLILGAYKVIVETRGKEFIYDTETENNIIEIAKWLNNPKSSIGLYLCGSVGLGKTNMIVALQSLIRVVCGNDSHFEDNELRIVSAVRLCEYARNNIELYNKYKKCKLLAIDDLGAEPAEIKDFGNVFYPIADIMDYRYQEQKFTIITTNMPADEIRKRYGLRISDRFKEMFTKVWFKNKKSYR